MLEDISNGFVKGIVWLGGWVVRMLVWAVIELFFWLVGWYVGWPVCRVVTLGALPAQSIHDHQRASELAHVVVSLVGILVVLGAPFALVLWVAA